MLSTHFYDITKVLILFHQFCKKIYSCSVFGLTFTIVFLLLLFVFCVCDTCTCRVSVIIKITDRHELTKTIMLLPMYSFKGVYVRIGVY